MQVLERLARLFRTSPRSPPMAVRVPQSVGSPVLPEIEEPQPTESEANLRADDGPDPLHREAA
jgi:hypothetical protein